MIKHLKKQTKEVIFT